MTFYPYTDKERLAKVEVDLDNIKELLVKYDKKLEQGEVHRLRLEQELKDSREEFRQEVKALREEFKQEMKDLREEFKQEMKDLREEMKDLREEMKDLREEMKDLREDLQAIKFWTRLWGPILSGAGILVIVTVVSGIITAAYYGWNVWHTYETEAEKIEVIDK